MGLDNRMFSVNSLANRFPSISGVDFESQYEIQTSRMKSSRVNLEGLVQITTAGSVSGNFALGSALDINSEISFNQPKQGNKTFGHPFVAIYQGTAAIGTNQIYPIRGAGVTFGRYDINADHDYHRYNGTYDRWGCTIRDTTGTSTQTISFYVRWIYADYTAQNAT